ncbi:unnamed protein product [Amoebophrya sp. A25]|nr:unnamed protein product [Amoebophrya sp. A25]|eukprot:GSA25T00026878001.1
MSDYRRPIAFLRRLNVRDVLASRSLVANWDTRVSPAWDAFRQPMDLDEASIIASADGKTLTPFGLALYLIFVKTRLGFDALRPLPFTKIVEFDVANINEIQSQTELCYKPWDLTKQQQRERISVQAAGCAAAARFGLRHIINPSLILPVSESVIRFKWGGGITLGMDESSKFRTKWRSCNVILHDGQQQKFASPNLIALPYVEVPEHSKGFLSAHKKELQGHFLLLERNAPELVGLIYGAPEDNLVGQPAAPASGVICNLLVDQCETEMRICQCLSRVGRTRLRFGVHHRLSNHCNKTKAITDMRLAARSFRRGPMRSETLVPAFKRAQKRVQDQLEAGVMPSNHEAITRETNLELRDAVKLNVPLWEELESRWFGNRSAAAWRQKFGSLCWAILEELKRGPQEDIELEIRLVLEARANPQESSDSSANDDIVAPENGLFERLDGDELAGLDRESIEVNFVPWGTTATAGGDGVPIVTSVVDLPEADVNGHTHRLQKAIEEVSVDSATAHLRATRALYEYHCLVLAIVQQKNELRPGEVEVIFESDLAKLLNVQRGCPIVRWNFIHEVKLGTIFKYLFCDLLSGCRNIEDWNEIRLILPQLSVHYMWELWDPCWNLWSSKTFKRVELHDFTRQEYETAAAAIDRPASSFARLETEYLNNIDSPGGPAKTATSIACSLYGFPGSELHNELHWATANAPAKKRTNPSYLIMNRHEWSLGQSLPCPIMDAGQTDDSLHPWDPEAVVQVSESLPDATDREAGLQHIKKACYPYRDRKKADPIVKKATRTAAVGGAANLSTLALQKLTKAIDLLEDEDVKSGTIWSNYGSRALRTRWALQRARDGHSVQQIKDRKWIANLLHEALLLPRQGYKGVITLKRGDTCSLIAWPVAGLVVAFAMEPCRQTPGKWLLRSGSADASRWEPVVTDLVNAELNRGPFDLEFSEEGVWFTEKGADFDTKDMLLERCRGMSAEQQQRLLLTISPSFQHLALDLPLAAYRVLVRYFIVDAPPEGRTISAAGVRLVNKRSRRNGAFANLEEVMWEVPKSSGPNPKRARQDDAGAANAQAAAAADIFAEEDAAEAELEEIRARTELGRQAAAYVGAISCKGCGASLATYRSHLRRTKGVECTKVKLIYDDSVERPLKNGVNPVRTMSGQAIEPFIREQFMEHNLKENHTCDVNPFDIDICPEVAGVRDL